MKDTTLLYRYSKSTIFNSNYCYYYNNSGLSVVLNKQIIFKYLEYYIYSMSLYYVLLLPTINANDRLF